MGCVNSIQVLAEANEYGKDIDPEWHEQFEALKLTTQELNRLYKAFVSYDLDESKGMDYAELLTALNLSKNRFTTRAFSVFDLDGDGELNFKEFVLSFWNVCTLNKETLYSLAFNLWDADSSGGISPKEINKALKEVYGKDKEFSEQDLEKVIRKSVAGRNFQKDITAEGIIIREQDFYLFTKHRPQLMQPALQLQHAMMTSVLGKGFWDAQALKRKKMIDEQTAAEEKMKQEATEKKAKKIKMSGKAQTSDNLEPESNKIHNITDGIRNPNMMYKNKQRASDDEEEGKEGVDPVTRKQHQKFLSAATVQANEVGLTKKPKVPSIGAVNSTSSDRPKSARKSKAGEQETVIPLSARDKEKSHKDLKNKEADGGRKRSNTNTPRESSESTGHVSPRSRASSSQQDKQKSAIVIEYVGGKKLHDPHAGKSHVMKRSSTESPRSPRPKSPRGGGGGPGTPRKSTATNRDYRTSPR